MVEDRRSLFVTGLKNAHAMENQAVSIIKPQLKRIENYPQVARRLEQHLQETENQMKRIEDILGSLDEDHSAMKDWMLSAGGSMARTQSTGRAANGRCQRRACATESRANRGVQS